MNTVRIVVYLDPQGVRDAIKAYTSSLAGIGAQPVERGNPMCELDIKNDVRGLTAEVTFLYQLKGDKK